MVRYSAEELENIFKDAGRIRKGKQEFKDDAGYWDGGACNWGGSHNLKNDCQTLANSLNKMDSLREIKGQLKACTSNQEYEAKKSNYIRKCEELINGLQTQTSSSSSMFNICCIWADQATNKNVVSKINICREALTKLKGDLQKETYKWVQEINQLKLEEKQITQRMEENKRKAMKKDISPSEKATLLQTIEEDGQTLKKNYEKQKELSNKFNFDPSKKVNDLIEKMKKAIERKNKNNRENNSGDNNQSDSEDSDSEDEETESKDEEKTAPLNPETNNNQPTNWWQENKELLILGGVIGLITFYLYYQDANEKQNRNLILLTLLAGGGYYFFIHLPNKRKKAVQEIKTMLQNSNVNLNNLNANLWKGANTWEKHLDKCCLSSQINLFVKDMKKEIQQKSSREERDLRQLRQEVIKNIENFAEKELEFNPSLEKGIKRFCRRIKQASNEDISIIEQEAIEFITQEKIKRQGLHWRREPQNWADRWLVNNRQSFESAWQEMTRIMGEEPRHFSVNAIYKVKFPPSLWSDLSESKKQLAKSKGYSELTLRDQVQNYRFNPSIDEWYEKVLSDPIRGEPDPNNPADLDNNALFYGEPRTGKSIKVEQLAYEADKYPLVVIQGSTLTPKSRDGKVNVDLLVKFIYTISTINNDLTDNFGYERTESGEPQYIFFIDEGDQVCTTNLLPPKDASSQLTFLKECMGSDDKVEESKNLWIVATNHLNNVDIAVYQSGRLSNALSFSWTLETFMYYAEEEGITSQFPDHWIKTKDLNSEDIKQVNRFNKILFDKFFLGKDKNGNIDRDKSFWDKFINNSDNKEILEEIKEEATDKDGKVITDEKTNKPKEIIKQKGIQLGEFFEFFWQKFDNKEIEEFDGKFTKPKKLNVEEAIIEASNHLSNTLDIRLKELEKASSEMLNEMKSNNDSFKAEFIKAREDIRHMLSEIGSKIR